MLTVALTTVLTTVLAVALATPAHADEAPSARAGAPFLAYPDEHIILDGSASSDPEGYDLDFSWSQTHGPQVLLQQADTVHPEFDVVDSATYTFQLIVNDGLQDSAPDTVDVIVVDPAIGGDPDATGCAAVPHRPIGLGWLSVLGGLVLLASHRRH